MKHAKLLIWLLSFAILSSCTDHDQLSRSAHDALKLTLTFDQEIYSSFDDVSGRITLENISDESLLVNGRLAISPVPWTPEFIECLLLIKNDNVSIVPNGKIDIDLPREDFFVILSPRQSIDKEFTLRGVGFSMSDFENNMEYDAIAVYQNLINVSASSGNKLIESWMGEIKSGTATFKLSP